MFSFTSNAFTPRSDSTDVACLYHAILTLGQIGKAPSRKGSLMAKHFFGLLDGLLKANPHDRVSLHISLLFEHYTAWHQIFFFTVI